MERSVTEYLVYLKENASQLRQEAKELGLTEQEITQCIEKALALDDNQNELVNSPKNIARKCFSYFRVLMKILFFIGFMMFAAVAGMYLLITFHEPTSQFMAKTAQPYGYDIFRAIRLVTLPLHHWMNISEYYNAECILDNPYFVDEFYFECNICASFKNLKVMNTSEFTEHGDDKFKAFTNTLKPIQLKGAQDRNVTYQDLRQMFLANAMDISESPHRLSSVDDRFTTLQTVFGEDIEEIINTSSSFRVDWLTHSVAASVGLRKLFPRPKFVPEKYEIALEKHVFITGPNASTFELPRLQNTIQVYIQGSGHRRVLVRPHRNCRDKCSSLLAFMDPGDALLFNYDVWRAHVAVNSEEPTVGYLLSLGFY